MNGEKAKQIRKLSRNFEKEFGSGINHYKLLKKAYVKHGDKRFINEHLAHCLRVDAQKHVEQKKHRKNADSVIAKTIEKKKSIRENSTRGRSPSSRRRKRQGILAYLLGLLSLSHFKFR